MHPQTEEGRRIIRLSPSIAIAHRISLEMEKGEGDHLRGRNMVDLMLAGENGLLFTRNRA